MKILKEKLRKKGFQDNGSYKNCSVDCPHLTQVGEDWGYCDGEKVKINTSCKEVN